MSNLYTITWNVRIDISEWTKTILIPSPPIPLLYEILTNYCVGHSLINRIRPLYHFRSRRWSTFDPILARHFPILVNCNKLSSLLHVSFAQVFDRCYEDSGESWLGCHLIDTRLVYVAFKITENVSSNVTSRNFHRPTTATATTRNRFRYSRS